MQHERIPRATAVAWSSGGAPQQTEARFAWIDRESGQRLELAVHGGEEFFHSLEAAGFERIAPLGDTPRAAAVLPLARAMDGAPAPAAERSGALAEDATAEETMESAPTDGVRELADWRGRGEGRGRVRRKGA